MRRDGIVDLLLEAEPDELRGMGSGAVARLVRDDAEARGLANRILDGLADTDRSLATISTASRPRRRYETSVARAPGRLRPAAAAGIAIAAIVALLLHSPGDTARPVVDTGDSQPGLAAGLAAASDRPFAVFETENPDIVVVWLFNEEESK